MQLQANATHEKNSRINGTKETIVYSDTGINTINKFAKPERSPRVGQNINISV